MHAHRITIAPPISEPGRSKSNQSIFSDYKLFSSINPMSPYLPLPQDRCNAIGHRALSEASTSKRLNDRTACRPSSNLGYATL